MEQDGWLKSKADESNIGPTRRVYQRAAKGRKELRSWLAAGPVVGTERVAHLAQVYFLADLDDARKSIVFFEELRDYMADRLATLEAVEQGWAAGDPRYPDDLPDKEFFSHLTLMFGLNKMRLSVEWCNDCIGKIEARDSAERSVQASA